MSDPGPAAWMGAELEHPSRILVVGLQALMGAELAPDLESQILSNPNFIASFKPISPLTRPPAVSFSQPPRCHCPSWTRMPSLSTIRLFRLFLGLTCSQKLASCEAFRPTQPLSSLLPNRSAQQRQGPLRHDDDLRQPAQLGGSKPSKIRIFSSNDESEDARSINSSRSSITSAKSIDGDETRKPTEETSSSSDDDSWNTIRAQAHLFQQMALPYYRESSHGRKLLAALLCLTLLNSGVSVAFSYLGKDFWNALSAKDAVEFYAILQKYLAALLVGAPVVTLYRYQREQLAVHWREWMTARTFDLYTSRRVYYTLQQSSSSIDNPDQRITEDVNSFTAYSLQLVITIITSIIDLVSFSTILWSIYPTLFGAIVAYALAGTVITAFLGKALVGLNYRQLSKEADLRYSLVRLRENAESIAFYGGEDLEGRAVEDRVEHVMDNRRQINAAQRNLEFFTTSYRYLVQILPVAVVAPRYFAGEIQLGVISQSVGAFNHILTDLSVIVNQFESLSAFSAGVERLSTFYDAIREADAARNATSPLLVVDAGTNGERTSMAERELSEPAIISEKSVDVDLLSESRIQVAHWDASLNRHLYDKNRLVLSIHDLDVLTPNRKRRLVHNLRLELREGEHLLIVGESGAGKSSLLRAIAGLWTSGTGTIIRPVDEHVYFLPQRPYCTLGTLKDQLLYPLLDSRDSSEEETNGATGNKIVPRGHLMKDGISDDRLIEVLNAVDLLGVATRAGDGDPHRGLHATLDWSNMLSLGEQQRLAFGRLLVNQPRLVILDEATSALDMAAEARMYALLQSMARKSLVGDDLSSPGLTYVSVGHRPSLLAFHDRRLRLQGEDGFELTAIDKGPGTIPLPTQVTNI